MEWEKFRRALVGGRRGARSRAARAARNPQSAHNQAAHKATKKGPTPPKKQPSPEKKARQEQKAADKAKEKAERDKRAREEGLKRQAEADKQKKEGTFTRKSKANKRANKAAKDKKRKNNAATKRKNADAKRKKNANATRRRDQKQKRQGSVTASMSDLAAALAKGAAAIIAAAAQIAAALMKAAIELASKLAAAALGMLQSLLDGIAVPGLEGIPSGNPAEDCERILEKCIQACRKGRMDTLQKMAESTPAALSRIDTFVGVDSVYVRCTAPCEKTREQCIKQLEAQKKSGKAPAAAA